MKFTPKTEEEIKAEGLFAPGEYDFEVIEETTFGTKTYRTEDAQSKASRERGETENNMIVLVLKVYDSNGRFSTIIDYLLESTSGKLRYAADTCGMIAKYEAGELHASDFVGKAGKARIGIQAGKPKDENNPNGERYPDKNVVLGYVKRKAETAQDYAKATGATAPSDLDDEIPF